MRICRRRERVFYGAIVAIIIGCGSEQHPAVGTTYAKVDSAVGKSVPNKARSVDINILFVGNSHTMFHDLPNLVGNMIRFRHPEKTVQSRVIGVGFLEDVARDPRCKEEIESGMWNYVVLQAQKESQSGRFEYSRKEGIDIAKAGKTRGAAVLFFAEWGLKDVAGHGQRIERIYQEMADAAGARIAPVGRAWDLALSARPDLQLHAADGNHQTALGAFLTACVLAGQLTDESPAALASFPYPDASESDRQFLAKTATKALTSRTTTADNHGDSHAEPCR